MKFQNISSNLIISEFDKIITSFLFECTKHFLDTGFHVHYISKTKVEEIPFAIHGGIKPNVDSFSRLTLKYFETPEQLLEYASELQYIQSRISKLPKVVVLQNLETYLTNEYKGLLIMSMLIDALNALAKAFNDPVYLIAGFSVKSPSVSILPSVCDNFFSSLWKIIIENEKGNLIKIQDLQSQNVSSEIKFVVGNDILFLESIVEHFKIS